jgi:hypothetical protein
MKLPIRKALGALAAASLLAVSANAATLIDEDFTGWSGTTALEGWTNTDISTVPGTGPGNLWNFDNNPSDAGGTPPNTPLTFTGTAAPLFTFPFANFDSDGFSSGSDPEDAVLTSPVFDATGASTVTVTFKHVFKSLPGSSWALESWNGTSWVNVAGGTTNIGTFSGRQTTAAGATSNASVDITASALAAGANAQIRFRWIGDWSWFWVVDNVQVNTVVAGTPQVSISDASVVEGNSGTTTASFTVTSNINAVDPIVLNWSTSNGTATTADGDYISASGSVTIPTGTSTASTTIDVVVNGDTNLEANETFNVTLTLVSGTASILDGTGVGTINNDDAYGAPLAFGADFFAGLEIFILDAANPTSGTFVNLGVPIVTNSLYSGGDFAADDASTFYVTDFNSTTGTGNIRSIDTGTGVVTLGPAITGLAAGDTIRNMKWDPETGKMMISFVTGSLATGVGKIADIDVNTGAVTNIVTLSPSTPVFAVYPHPTTGVLYGTSASTDTFFSINKTTGAVTTIGSLTQLWDQFSGDGDFSADGTTLYVTATVNPPFFNWLSSINLATGAATQIADIETARGLGQTSAFGIPHANLVSSVADWTTIE